MFQMTIVCQTKAMIQKKKEDQEFENILRHAREERKQKRLVKKRNQKVYFKSNYQNYTKTSYNHFKTAHYGCKEMMLKIFEEQNKADMAEHEKDQ